MRTIIATVAAAGLAALSGTAAQAQSARYGMANPAATYCAQIGGRSTTRYDRNGGAIGYCRLRDGREVDEWQLYRDRGRSTDDRVWNDPRERSGYDDRTRASGDPAARSCTRGGGRYYVARPTTGGRERGWCRTRDGRIWDAWQLYRQYGGGQGWNDDERNGGYRDYSYQEQYRSWDDRSDRRYDGQDDERYDDGDDDRSSRRDDDGANDRYYREPQSDRY